MTRPGDPIPDGETFGGSWVPLDGEFYRPQGGAGFVERLRAVDVPLPCAGCARADLCDIRPTVEAIAFREVVSPHPDVRVETRISVFCDRRVARRGLAVMPVEVRRKMADAWTPERRAAAAIRLTALNLAGKAGKRARKAER